MIEERQIEYVDITEDEGRTLIKQLDLVGVVHMGGDVVLYYKRADADAVEAREIATYGEIDVYVAMWPNVPNTWAKNVAMIKSDDPR